MPSEHSEGSYLAELFLPKRNNFARRADGLAIMLDVCRTQLNCSSCPGCDLFDGSRGCTLTRAARTSSRMQPVSACSRSGGPLDDVRRQYWPPAVSDPFVPAGNLPQLSVESQLLHVDGQHTRSCLRHRQALCRKCHTGAGGRYAPHIGR